MTFENLISICKPERVFGEIPKAIGALQQDSRNLNKGDVFIAVRGLQTDGHEYIEHAVAEGASVIICEKPAALTDGRAAVLEVKSTRPLLGPLAQAFRNYPASSLACIGITGTNGKTTVATLVWQVLQKMDVKAGLLGTVAKQYGETRAESRLTTSDPIELAADMRMMADMGCEAVCMEVSSHALEQARTTGIEWDVAAFTNLSHDHLDYHKNMTEYAAAKKKLFDALKPSGRAIINADDPYGPEMVRDYEGTVVAFSFSREETVTCKRLRSDHTGSRISAGGIEISTPLVGQFNAANVVEAFLICRALGYSPERIAKELGTCTGAPGRLERVTAAGTGPRPTVFVDYAHTPAALENAASTLREVKDTGQELIIVFGCGGDRDVAKRPEMARIAWKTGDQVVVTSDNPRNEDPRMIIRDIEQGFPGHAEWISIPSREEAIRRTIRNAAAHCIVLIAGKGHETWQEIHGKRLPFDDREIARSALEEIQNSTTGEEL